VDVAPQAVEGAQAEPDRPANLTFQVADAYALPFPDASFDVVHAHQVLHHLADPPAAIREMLRVARPGGLVALREADYGAAFWYPDATAWRAWQQSYQLLAGGGGTEVDAGRRLPSWLDQAKVAGQVRFSGTLWTYPGFAPAAEIANSWADRLTERRFVDLATGTGVADEASLVRAATGLIEWARHPDAFFAMPHVEAIIDLT
jgi:SAM-dependent methyltransferase